MTDKYTTALNKMRDDITALAASATHAGVEDGDPWHNIVEMLLGCH